MAVRAAVVDAVKAHSERAAALVADVVGALLSASHGSWDLFMVYASCLRVRLKRGTARAGNKLDQLALQATSHMGAVEALCDLLLDLSQGEPDDAAATVTSLQVRRQTAGPQDIFAELFGEAAETAGTANKSTRTTLTPLKPTRPPFPVRALAKALPPAHCLSSSSSFVFVVNSSISVPSAQDGQVPHALWEKLYGSPNMEDMINSLQGSTPLQDLTNTQANRNPMEEAFPSPVWKFPMEPTSPCILLPPPPAHAPLPQPARLLPCRALHADFANAGDMFT